MSEFTEFDLTATGHEAITVGGVAVGFTDSKLAPSTGAFKGVPCCECFFTVEGNSIRCCWDGTTPTLSVGHLLNDGDQFALRGDSNISKFRAIQNSGSATLHVTYYHRGWA